MRQIVESSLGALLGAETYADVHQVIVSVGEALGYAYYGYQYWPGGEEYGDRNFAGLVQCNYPQAWLVRYVDQSYYDIDPVRLFGIAQEGVVEWHQLDTLQPAQQEFMQEAARFGIEDGVIGSFHDSEGGRLQLAYACAAGAVAPGPGLETLQVAGPLMTVCLRKASHTESRIRWLTERQRDSLFQMRRLVNRERFANS
ncbi:MAG: autoinducer binding domain-containing protein [Sphingomonadales bacterium]